MPSPGKIVLVRHDGTTLEATKEQAERLKILGYTEQSDAERAAEVAKLAREDYYTGTDQKIAAAVEGLGAGMTFGASDYLFGDDDTKARAAYNPGTRIGTEVLGALVPLVLSGGQSAAVRGAQAVEEAGVLSRAASKTPTELLSKAAKALAPGAEGSLTKAVTRGAIEGSVYGATGAADHAWLDGEPITAETVLHGLGWGAVVGGALGAVGQAVERAGKEAAAKPTTIPHGTLNKTSDAQFGALRAELETVKAAAKEATKAADASVKDTMGALLKRGEGADLVGFGRSEPAFVKSVRETEKLYDRVAKAVEAGKFKQASEASAAYVAHVNDVATKLGVEMPNPGAALDELISLRAVAKELNKLPDDVSAFANMTPQRMERLVAAVERAKKLPTDSGPAINDAIAQLSNSLGIEVEKPGNLRAVWKAARSLSKSEGSVLDPKPGIMARVVGTVLGSAAYGAARSVGAGPFAGMAAFAATKRGVTNLAAVRASTHGRLRTAAGEFMPGAGRAIKMASPYAALGINLFGGKDDSTKNPRELAANRLREIGEFAPTAKDTIYRAVEPLSVSQPALAPSIHAAALQSFNALRALSPRDPGAINALKSIWRPSELQAALLGKQLAVFHDPVGEAEAMLKSGQFDATKVKALKDMAPAIWQDLRTAVLERITRPEVASKLDYNTQIGLSNMLDLAIHSSMQAGFIATSQQIFVDRNKPLAASPRIGQDGGLPNPKDNIATGPQKSTER